MKRQSIKASKKRFQIALVFLLVNLLSGCANGYDGEGNTEESDNSSEFDERIEIASFEMAEGDSSNSENVIEEVIVIPEIGNAWLVTQYPSTTGNQSMFYTIRNVAEDILILVDGGYGEDSEMVRQIILGNGGNVSAWILTHYHADHIGAFNVLYPEMKESIDSVYITPMDQDLYYERARSYDRPEVYQEFLDITQNA
jgi:hypothetical protein